jgi:hypothetical protein
MIDMKRLVVRDDVERCFWFISDISLQGSRLLVQGVSYGIVR